MKRKIVLCHLGAVLLATTPRAEAQLAAKPSTIGRLSGIRQCANAVRMEAFREGQRELGYVEGKSIVIDRRAAIYVDKILKRASPPICRWSDRLSLSSSSISKPPNRSA